MQFGTPSGNRTHIYPLGGDYSIHLTIGANNKILNTYFVLINFIIFIYYCQLYIVNCSQLYLNQNTPPLNFLAPAAILISLCIVN